MAERGGVEEGRRKGLQNMEIREVRRLPAKRGQHNQGLREGTRRESVRGSVYNYILRKKDSARGANEK